MRADRVLITGGAGMIGSTIAEQLGTHDVNEIVVFDNFSRGRRGNLPTDLGRIRIVEGDIRDRRRLAEVMAGVDVVFHQAAIRITRCAEQPREALEVLVDGSFNVFEAAHAAGVSRVIAASSASVYGLAEEFPTPERNHPYANRTLYGAAKAFNEGMLRSFHEMYGLPYVGLRYFNVYGPKMDIHGLYTEVLIRWMERMAAGRPPLILGDGSQTMDFVYVDDVARANILAAESDVDDVVLNIASGVETSLIDLARSLAMAMGSELTPVHAAARKVNGVSRRLADTSLARRLLGFDADVGLAEGLRRLVAWWSAESSDALGAPA